MSKVNDLERDNFELAKAFLIVSKQLETAINGLENIKDSHDLHNIAKQCLEEIENLGQK